MELNHSALSLGIVAAEQALRYFDGVVGHVSHQIIGLFPSFSRGLSDDQVEPQTKPNPSSCASSHFANLPNLLGNLSWSLTPGEVNIRSPGGY
jgi:hypothetical protein